MKRNFRTAVSMLAHVSMLAAVSASAQDWPQWRGPNRDGKTSGFACPQTWPKELAQKWKTPVGQGDASPAVVGDKVYVFTRQETNEMVACLDAATGKEIWKQQYESQKATEPMGRHPGPRSSPTVAGGKVVACGARGVFACFDAATGKLAWRKDDFAGSGPKFFTSSSPLVVDGLCVAQLGSEDKGGVIAYDLNTGAEKWKWTEDGTAYSSPAVMTVQGTKMIVAMTTKKVVGLGLDGKLLWEVPFAVQGRSYNAATPIVDGQTVIYAGGGRGTKALKIEKTGDSFAAKELWSNSENSVQFNTPVLKDNRLYGLSQKGELFCLEAQAGKTLWVAPIGGKDFGSIVDMGGALMALTTQGELTVFEPSDKELKKLASYKIAENETYAYPVPAGNGIYIKDQDSVALWALH